jgi:hypothetical protein
MFYNVQISTSIWHISKCTCWGVHAQGDFRYEWWKTFVTIIALGYSLGSTGPVSIPLVCKYFVSQNVGTVPLKWGWGVLMEAGSPWSKDMWEGWVCHMLGLKTAAWKRAVGIGAVWGWGEIGHREKKNQLKEPRKDNLKGVSLEETRVFLVLAALESRLRVSHLLGRHCTTWATSPALFCVGYLPRLALNRNPLDLCFLHS